MPAGNFSVSPVLSVSYPFFFGIHIQFNRCDFTCVHIVPILLMQFRFGIYDKIVTKRLHLHFHDYNSRMPFGQVISRLFHDFFRSADWTFSCAAVILILCADFVFLWHIISRKGFPLTQIMAALPGIYTATKKMAAPITVLPSPI